MKSTPMPRLRVDAHLRSAVASARLTVLQAPLGAGKSSAAATAFAQDAHVVQMRAEPWHRGAFVAALVSAVGEVRPEFGRLTLGALEAGAGSTHLGRTFALELAHVQEPLLLIVDNVHVFKDESGFSRFIEAAVSAAPAQVRILALGRSLPEIALGRSIASGSIRILDGSFLAFTSEEVGDLARWMQRDLDDDRISRVLEWTEGWAAGVALALTAPDVPGPAAGGPHDWAERYLTKQLLTRLDPQTVRFLEDTSVFETLDLRVLGEIMNAAEVRERLTDLRRTGALLTQVRTQCFRVHPVLRELARARLKDRGDLGQAQAQAAQAYANAGAIAAAMFHADAAGAGAASLLLRRHADAALATGDHDLLRKLATRVDANGADRDVRFYVDALLEKTRGSGQAREAFARAADASERSGDDALYFRARSEVFEFDLGRTLQSDAATLADLRRRSATLGARAMATAAMLEGWTHAISYDFPGALASIAPLDGVDDPEAQFNCGILRAYTQTAMGDADAAEKTLDELLHTLENRDRLVMQTLTLIWFARLALISGRTNTAADAAVQAARLAERLDLRAEEAALYVALAEVATHSAAVRDAVHNAERAKSRSEYAWYSVDVDRVRAFSEIVLARAAFLGHDNAIARELSLRTANAPNVPPVQRAVALAEASIYTLLCQSEDAGDVISSARSAIAGAAPADAADAVALAVADDVIAFLDAADGRTHETSLKGCEPFAALLAQRRGLVTLEHAGIAAGKARRREGSAEAFDTALTQITRDGPRFEARLARAYVSTFIRPQKVPDPPAMVSELTARESEILVLLAEGLTNKEIAQRLFLSPRTIETHVEHVLGKLDVGSRSRAIAKAIRLGLVHIS